MIMLRRMLTVVVKSKALLWLLEIILRAGYLLLIFFYAVSWGWGYVFNGLSVYGIIPAIILMVYPPGFVLSNFFWKLKFSIHVVFYFCVIGSPLIEVGKLDNFCLVVAGMDLVLILLDFLLIKKIRLSS